MHGGVADSSRFSKMDKDSIVRTGTNMHLRETNWPSTGHNLYDLILSCRPAVYALSLSHLMDTAVFPFPALLLLLLPPPLHVSLTIKVHSATTQLKAHLFGRRCEGIACGAWLEREREREREFVVVCSDCPPTGPGPN